MRTCLLGIAILALYVPSAAAREWTDKTGTKKVEAELIRVENDVAYLRLPNGDLRSTTLDRLSGEDRETALSFAAAASRKQSVVASTLAFRKTATASRVPVPAPVDDPAERAFFKLTGWSRCTPWYCCDVTTCHPHVPCPPQVDYGKRIFKGCKCTFHLVSASGSSAPIPRNGTVAYEFHDKNGCCHRYLAYLTYNTSGGPWVVYAADGSPGGVSHWLINFTGLGSSCSHQVMWWNGSGWVPYDWTCREIPE